MKKTKLLYFSLIAGLLVSGLTLNTTKSNAQEVVSGYNENTDENTIYYEEGTKLSDIYDVYGVEKANSVTDSYNNGISPLETWTALQYNSKTIQPGYTYLLVSQIKYSSKNYVKVIFTTDKTCDMVAGLNLVDNNSVYATQKVSCKANVPMVTYIPLEKGKTVDAFILNINGFNVEVSNVEVHFVS
ncbi:MAG: hypothetical protein HFH66_13205 [Lachnospiraceae bacterium]|nr:hypothetical protein [Lachnospiraceae bacterium]